MKEAIYEQGYNQADEVLNDAEQPQIDQWNKAKQELLKKDAMIDHASQKISLSYKGAVVDHKLGKLRQKMIADDHSLVIGEHYDKLE